MASVVGGAETDNYAVWVLERAASVGVNVPKDLAVLGVDNDELLCDMAEPPLSSIAVDHERLGELAGEAMGRLLAASGGRRPKAARRRAADAAEPFTLMAPVISPVSLRRRMPSHVQSLFTGAQSWDCKKCPLGWLRINASN